MMASLWNGKDGNGSTPHPQPGGHEDWCRGYPPSPQPSPGTYLCSLFPKYMLASATELTSSPPGSYGLATGGAYQFPTLFNWEQTFTSLASLPVTLYCEQCLSPSQGLTQVSLTLPASPGLQEPGVDWSQAISRVHGGKPEPYCSPTTPPSPSYQNVLPLQLHQSREGAGSQSGPARGSLLASLGSVTMGYC